MFENPDLKALGFNDLEDFGHLQKLKKDGKPALMDEFEIQKTTHFSSLESLSTNQ